MTSQRHRGDLIETHDDLIETHNDLTETHDDLTETHLISIIIYYLIITLFLNTVVSIRSHPLCRRGVCVVLMVMFVVAVVYNSRQVSST